ncbi:MULTISPECIES: GNAT family N-acetyltransferase [unclassified Mesorhizobium]|uniref:GNAT family N-acetyltransferase n=1 Tax=unclassified Mesorhizobium TaxID=325217 RepID=UPI0010937E51|nr:MULTISPECIES: GNAT family N-acetyltransferase [unclassified Mesorhizobium]TGS39955.1 GNAT family N-acetyltransferase [Mesorhizobium sp. M8A.F.Ca.ET.182.01.1.1]TGS78727.1 GNAT family N-acetyltransferase [Mesorhizobium sp. M8A.F.Ca.ET.181.01.1.1]TIT63653.1 MAG: GNAT family N-acetyltransferase [Mesorhizobium sp.]TIU48715.1 MAG: GNAT family N-acetyltransferase [Mesorhizobium sp.]
MIDSAKIALRPAVASDAAAIARILRAALNSFDWMPVIHTPAEDLAFIRDIVLPNQQVTVAEDGADIVGFIAVIGDWVEQLYLDPASTGQGIGSRLLMDATAALPQVKLHCFQANTGARRFYERHGFQAEAFGDGTTNEEGLPDILYVRRR